VGCCKQGNCLSPLKSNLFLDQAQAVKYINDRGLGYKYELKQIPSTFSPEDIEKLQAGSAGTNCIISAVLGHMDDCLFLGSKQ
jgi:hypothetical protein